MGDSRCDRFHLVWAPTTLAFAVYLCGCGGSNDVACIPSPRVFLVTNSSGGPNQIFKAPPNAGSPEGNTPISGTAVVASISSDGKSVVPSGTPVPNASVWLEQQSHSVQIEGGGSDTVENLIAMATTDSNGNFTFCVGAAGKFEVVVDAQSLPSQEGSSCGNLGPDLSCAPANSTATITTGVKPGGGKIVIPLPPSVGASIAGTITTKASSSPGPADDVAVAAIQPFSGASPGPGGVVPASAVWALIPFFSSGTSPLPPIVTTNSTGSGNPSCSSVCPAGTNCACYKMAVPASNPVVGGPSADGSGYAPPSSSSVGYAMDGQTTARGTAAPVCSPSELASGEFTLDSGNRATTELDFTGCD